MNTSVYKVFCYFLLAFSLLISSRSFGLSGSSSDSVDLEKSYLSLDQLDESEVIVLDEDHQLAKNLLEAFDLQPDQKVMVVALDQNQQPINLEEDGSELLSMINSELEVKQSLDQLSYKTLDLDDVDQMALDQINDYNIENGQYQNILVADNLNHELLNYAGYWGFVGAMFVIYGVVHRSISVNSLGDRGITGVLMMIFGGLLLFYDMTND